MPTKEEVDALVEEKKDIKPEENPSNPQEPDKVSAEDIVSPEDARKVSEMYNNMRTVSNRKDSELHELREKVKTLEKKDELPIKKEVSIDTDDPEEIESLKETLKKLGVPLGSNENDIRAQVEKEISIREATVKLMSDLNKISEQRPYVKPKQVLDFITARQGNVSLEEAIKLLYEKENTAFEKDPTFIPETDTSKRTLSTKGVPSYDDDEAKPIAAPYSMKNRGGGIRDFVASRLAKAADSLSGK